MCVCMYGMCLLQMGSEEGERLLVMAATNRPQEIDDAALRWVGHVGGA